VGRRVEGVFRVTANCVQKGSRSFDSYSRLGRRVEGVFRVTADCVQNSRRSVYR